MATIGVDPATGMLTLDGQVLDRNDPRLWGSRGRQHGGYQDYSRGTGDAGDDPIWVGPTDGWDALQSLGRYQLNSAGLSSGQEGQGFGEFNINHLADLQYDPEYGITTSNQDFIDSSEDPDDRARMRRWRTAMLIAATGGMAAEAGLFGGVGAGGVDAATGYGLGGSAGEAGATAGMGGMGGAAGGVGGLASEIAPGYLSESVAPQVTEVMAGSPWEIAPGYLTESVAPQVTEQMAGNPYSTPSVSVDPMLEESVAPQVTETMSGSPFSQSWLDKLPDLARDLLGGGQQGGGNPVIAALMGATGKFGDHKQDNDPYGLQASGYGPWKGLLDDPKSKVVDAMMKRKQDSIWS